MIAKPASRSLQLALLMCLALVVPSAAPGLTRTEALSTASGYMLVTYDVTSANIYPAISCYDPSNPDYLQKLEPGTYTGLPYSHRAGPPLTPGTIVTHLYDAPQRGAGNSGDFDKTHGSCVQNYTTGVDCSQFVSAAWHLTNRFTTPAMSTAIASPLSSKTKVLPADAFNWSDHHVVLFATVVDGTTNLFTSYEANGPAGKTVVKIQQNYNDWFNKGYLPWCSNSLKDTPAADVFALSAGPRDACLVVGWETLLERNTQAFVVERGQLPDGPFAGISDELAPRGQDGGGARYEFLDTSNPTGPVYYQLREIQTAGPDLLHGVVGPVTLSTSGQERRP